MKNIRCYLLFFLVINILPVLAQTDTGSVFIKGSSYRPLYLNDTGKVAVASFYLDKYPVSNQEFLKFVKQYPQWQKGKVGPLFADSTYLQQWKSAKTIGKDSIYIYRSPVTNVSWYAAKAYCECQGKRLPTTNEWELAGLADNKQADASDDSLFYTRILAEFSKPKKSFLPPVGQSEKNFYGVYDMHGIIFEWTLDFNASLSTGESRSGSKLDRNNFCGGGAINARNLKNYSAFLRYALRASVKAKYCIKNLGFRCAKPAKP